MSDAADLAALAAEAYIYGFPLVFDLGEVDRFNRKAMGGVPATPFNVFGHAGRLAAPADTPPMRDAGEARAPTRHARVPLQPLVRQLTSPCGQANRPPSGCVD
jgi:hypothetical protein